MGNDLLISEYSNNKISKINIMDINPVAEEVVTGLTGPTGLVLNGNDLYIAEQDTFKVSKFTYATTAVNAVLINQNLQLYPNPSTDYIQITGLSETENYIIYSIYGTEVLNGTATKNEKIDIGNLSNGVYFLKQENGNTTKFIKD